MRTNFIFTETIKLKEQLYDNLNNFSQSNKTLGRFCSIPVSILDVGLDICSTPLSVIEYAAMAAINLVGAVFSKKCTLKDSLAYTEYTLRATVNIPVTIVIAPIKLIFQFFAIIIDPEKVKSSHYGNPTFQV
jgi:hypothetical protein